MLATNKAFLLLPWYHKQIWDRLSCCLVWWWWIFLCLFLLITLRGDAPFLSKLKDCVLFWWLVFSSYSLLVVKNPSLTSLGLRSLRKINDGAVYITGNNRLCYHDTVNWTRLFNTRPKHSRQKIEIKENRPRSECGELAADKQWRCPCWWRYNFKCSHSPWGPHVRPPLLLWWLLGSGAKPMSVLQEVQQRRDLCAGLHVLRWVSSIE